MKYLIVGLGNPGEEYTNTRHNVGFLLLDALPTKSDWVTQKKGVWEEAVLNAGPKTMLVRPLTFMNTSGTAVGAATRKHGVKPDNIVIIHDELDMELGTLKMTYNKSAGTHKGVASVIKHVRTKKFWRIRVGITPKKKPASSDMKDFLLRNMTGAEKKKVLAHKEKVVEGILLWLENHEKGMQHINTD